MAHYGVKLERSDVLKLPAHPAGPTVRTLRAWCGAEQQAGRLIALDLFCGAGGLSSGLEAAGWSVAAAVDHDPRALETHRHNFPGLALDLDLGDADARKTFLDLFRDIDVDLVAGGPPCQPFSRAGRSKIRSLVDAGVRSAVDERRELWRAFLDIALALNPRAVLMENVPDMGLGDDFRVVRIMIDELEQAGYRTDCRLVDAWRHGVPQHRKRLLLLARRDGASITWNGDAIPLPTLRDSIGDLPRLGRTTGGRELTYVQPKRLPKFAKRMRDGAERGVVHDHMTRPVRDDDREIFAMMGPKTLYSDVPAHLRRYTADTFDDKYKRLDWHDVSRSITAHIAKDGYWYIHPEEHRTLTVREAARVQTFPDRFRFAGTRSDAFRQIGNAVPPMLGEAAATVLRPQVPPAPADHHDRDWQAMRRALTKWAKAQQSGALWHMLPGRGNTLPVALAAAVTSNSRMAPEQLGTALQHLRGLGNLPKAALDETVLCVGGTKTATALERLRPLIRQRNIWYQPDALASAVRLAPAEQQVFDLLRGEDLLLRTQGARRVAARVVGTDSDQVNHLTDGRIDLARLVGAGEDAPLRMAAVRLIGATMCASDGARCTGCPLATWCATSGAIT